MELGDGNYTPSPASQTRAKLMKTAGAGAEGWTYGPLGTSNAALRPGDGVTLVREGARSLFVQPHCSRTSGASGGHWTQGHK